jgi:D-threo-aldose 1-dehydrogenase
MTEVCRLWGTDLATAALQFSLRDPTITATVTGFTKQSTLDRTLAAVEVELPDAFWEELESLVPGSEHWLDNNDPIL